MTARPLRALIVEDDQHDVRLITDSLQEYGYDVSELATDNAVDMERLLRSTTFDVVLADYRMPRFSGPDALELLTTLGIDIPFILVSAAVGDEVAVDIVRRGAADYVLKDHLGRLGHSVERELRTAAERRERAAREESLAEMRRRFQETFEHAPIGIVHADLSGRISLANHRFCEILGYERDELLGRWLGELTDPRDLNVERRALAALYAGRRITHQAEKRCIRRDGSTAWVNFTATAIRGALGDVEYVVGMIEDITRRREAEERIRLQARLLDAVEQAVVATDSDGTITFWSRFAAELYGWSAEEVIGRDSVEIFRPGVSAEEISEMLLRLARGTSWSGEMLLTRRDGTVFPAMVLLSPIFGDDGAPAGIVGVSMDLTERKAGEAALKRSEERYRGVMEGVEEMILSVDVNGRIRSVNRAFETTTGWLADEIVGQLLFVLSPPEMRDAAMDRFQARLRGELIGPIEGPMMTKDGAVLTVDTLGFERRGGDEVVEIFYFCRDLTARKVVEQERARLARELRLLLESTAEGIYAVDAEGRCTLANRAAAKILGYSAEELFGRSSHDLFHHAHADGSPYHFDECPLHRVLTTGCTEWSRDDVFWRSDGTPVPVEYSCAPIIDDGKVIGAVKTFVDLSDRRLLETQLDRANRLNGLGRVAATMAHEMNNVLMGIQPFAELLRRHVRNDEAAGLIEAITRSVRRGGRITSEILRFTRQAKPVLEPLDVSSWLTDLQVEARALLGVNIAFEAGADEPLVIAGDSRELVQIFLNMIINARDARARRITLSVGRAVAARYPFGVIDEGKPYAHFVLSDDGGGIPANALDHIFEPLFTTKESGTGLGLALAHNVIKQHGGEIFVETRQREGTTFHVFIPFAEEAVPAVAAANAELPNLRSVVLVEDEVAVAEGMAALLESDGFSVAVAMSGGAALDVIEASHPDAVVLDVGLPDIDGAEVYDRIVARYPALPVVFASGHADASRFASLVQRPNVAYLTKPYELSELYAALASVMGNSRTTP